MRYARAHARIIQTKDGIARRTYLKGDPYDGDLHNATRLYQRGVLEPDGSPNDHLVTGANPPETTWHDGQEYQQEEH